MSIKTKSSMSLQAWIEDQVHAGQTVKLEINAELTAGKYGGLDTTVELTSTSGSRVRGLPIERGLEALKCMRELS